MRALRAHHPPDHGRGDRGRLRHALRVLPERQAPRVDERAGKSAFEHVFRRQGFRRQGGAFPLVASYILRKVRAIPNLLPSPDPVRDVDMQGDARVIEYLNRGLRHELTAINQYWLHYRLLDNLGHRALAKKWRKESIEEMEHGDKLVERIIFLDGFPNMQVLDPLHIGQNVREVLDSDLALEMAARALYQEAATHCHAVKDYVSRDLFEKLMHDEEEHIDFLETQLDLVSKLGLELYAQHHIGKLDDDHDS
jgi:bacterioferritin